MYKLLAIYSEDSNSLVYLPYSGIAVKVNTIRTIWIILNTIKQLVYLWWKFDNKISTVPPYRTVGQQFGGSDGPGLEQVSYGVLKRQVQDIYLKLLIWLQLWIFSKPGNRNGLSKLCLILFHWFAFVSSVFPKITEPPPIILCCRR